MKTANENDGTYMKTLLTLILLLSFSSSSFAKGNYIYATETGEDLEDVSYRSSRVNHTKKANNKKRISKRKKPSRKKRIRRKRKQLQQSKVQRRSSHKKNTKSIRNDGWEEDGKLSDSQNLRDTN